MDIVFDPTCIKVVLKPIIHIHDEAEPMTITEYDQRQIYGIPDSRISEVDQHNVTVIFTHGIATLSQELFEVECMIRNTLMRTRKCRVNEAKPGEIIETMIDGIPTGNVYKVAMPNEIIGRVTCYTQFTNIKVQVHPTNWCRILDPALVEGF